MGWRKGESGNPGGRPRARHDLRALVRERTVEAVATLVKIMRNRTNLIAAKGAAEILLHYGYGRPSNVVTFDVEHGDTPAHIEVSFVSPGQVPPDDDPRLLPDMRSPHLPHGRRSN